jgi:hypothetical protein
LQNFGIIFCRGIVTGWCALDGQLCDVVQRCRQVKIFLDD